MLKKIEDTKAAIEIFKLANILQSKTPEELFELYQNNELDITKAINMGIKVGNLKKIEKLIYLTGFESIDKKKVNKEILFHYINENNFIFSDNIIKHLFDFSELPKLTADTMLTYAKEKQLQFIWQYNSGKEMVKLSDKEIYNKMMQIDIQQNLKNFN